MKNFDTPLRRVLFLVFILFALVTAFVFATRQRAAGPAAGQETPLAPLSGCATPSFAAAANFGAGTTPFAVTVGDFNQDGKPDLATANANSNNVSVLLGNGAGSFGAATNFSVGGTQPLSVAAGDFNQDGKPDLATANNGSNNLSVLLGNGVGSFGTATNFNAGTDPSSITVGDFNLDGRPDLAAANSISDNVSLLLGNGAGSFGAASNFGVGPLPVSVAAGDFNLDGKTDLAVANFNSNNVSVLLGNGAGNLGGATNFGVGASPNFVATGDFNLDGKPDLVTANDGPNNLSVLLGDGVGSFGTATNFNAGTAPSSVIAGDFNQDGRPDLATANLNSNNVSVLLGNGAGSFGAATNFGAGTNPASVAVGDFNLDGRPDLATANQISDNASVLLNTCNGTPCGGTAFAAAANFGAGTTPQSVAAGDFNLDGRPDLAATNFFSNDISVLLGNGAGGFGAAANFGVGGAPLSVAVSDFNLDGKPDLATANGGSNNVSVLLGNGAGSFGAAANFNVGADPESVIVGDFNLDGKPDLATANLVSDNVSVLLGNGIGSFGAAANFSVGADPESVAAGDFNLDGKPDLATANGFDNEVSVLLGNGVGSFGAVTNFNAGTAPSSIIAGDFNQDGRPDLATANLNSNNISVLLGNGAGSFGAATNFGAGTNPASVAVGDFNLDGKPDLATANANSNNVSVLLGNGAGSFGAATNFSVGGTQPNSVVAGDFNLDGMPDLATANGPTNNVSVFLNSCAPATSLVVINTNDSGAGSLRQAILDSNAQAGADTITFNIPGGGVQTITPALALPTITQPVIIDGYTQPGSSVNTLAVGSDAVLLIELKGPAGGSGVSGLDISAGNSIVRGLIINGFGPSPGAGINLNTEDNNRIEGCWIGTNATGAAAAANVSGVVIGVDSGGNTIGGNTPDKRNVISGNSNNGLGLFGDVSGNTVQNNYIGTDKTGAASIPNGNSGIQVTSANNQIGGTAAANTRNVISGNSSGVITQGSGSVIEGNFIGTDATGAVALGNGNGVAIFGPGNRIGGPTAASRNVISANINGIGINEADNNTIQGNFIGTNAAGTAALGNTQVGIGFGNSAQNTTIGGLAATPGQAPGNLISGNGFGIFVGGGAGVNDALGSVIQGNLIGTDINGALPLGNTGSGITLGELNVTVGGAAAGAGNRIAFNGGSGVSVGSLALGNRISASSIFNNGALGLDLGGDGVTPNDAGDGDTGANNLQNFPVLTASSSGANTVVNGMLNSTANTTFRVEFFSVPTCDASNNGEGQVFLGATDVTTDAGGNATINVNTLAAVAVGQVVTATATNLTTNDTSEFSACRTVTAPASCATLPANAVSWYRAENNANDQLGGAAGALANGTTFTTGQVRQAFNFDGNDDRVLLGNPANLQLQTFTIETWIKRASATLVTNNPFPGFTNGIFLAYGQEGYGFLINGDGTLGLTKVGVNGVNSAATITDTNYHHVAVTKSGNTVIFFIDGVAGTPVTYNETFSFTTNAALGARGDNELRGDFFGAVDELTIYQRSLAEAEIQAIVSAGSTGKCRLTATLTGRLGESANQPLAGVTVALSGAVSATTVTDNNGNYTFDILTLGGNYAVIPRSPAFVFSPARADFTNLTADQTQNFTAQTGLVPPAAPPFMDDFPPRPNPDPDKWGLGILTQPPGAFDPNVTVSQQTGQLVITPVANAVGLHFGGYASVNSVDLSNGQAAVELVQAGTGGAQSLFSIGTDFLNFSRFQVVTPLPNQPLLIEEVINGVKQAPFEGTMPMLMFQLVQNGVVFLNVAIPYDPVAHRFLRFRHLARDANNNPANLLVFETSPDASAYTERARGDLGERSVAAITVELAGGTAGLAGNPGPVIFDNLVTQVVNARFALAAVTVSEGAGSVTLNVTRTGLTNLAGAMEYSTQDGTATQRTRYVAASGVLSFATGETTKSLQILLLDNALVDGSQDFNVFLGPGQGLGVNGPGRTIVTITDNDVPPITTNPLETPSFFVTQQYYDFLSRPPDAAGLAFWVGQIIDPCGGNAACISQRRWNVSNAFFFELEFQQTGSYVYRLYRAAYGNTQPFPNSQGDMDTHPFCMANPANCQLIRAAHIPNYAKFINDRARLDAGNLAATQLSLTNAFVNRAEFRQRYPVTQTAAQFVDTLISNIQTASGANLTSQRDALIALHNASGRGAVLYRLADDNTLGNPINNRAFIDAEYSRSFVLTQYFGYLRRDPDMPGLNFWLGIINRFPLRAPTGQNAMVCAFITSGEYQTRFSLITPRTDAECPTPP